MLRAVIYALISIFVISLVRLFAGIVMRGFSDALKEQTGNVGEPPKRGELKKCSVCGTYAPQAAAPVLKGVDAFVCSDACASKYRA